jgi:hypothetical protein
MKTHTFMNFQEIGIATSKLLHCDDDTEQEPPNDVLHNREV